MQDQRKAAGLTALTIAGFDPSSGAGITADLAVFAAHGVFGISAITALTVQSTTGVRRTEPVNATLLADTLACLQEDLPPDGIKIGMLGGAGQVRAVVGYLRSIRGSTAQPVVVLDPVLRSSSGASLLSEEGATLMLGELLPLVDAITPNAAELAVLTGLSCRSGLEIPAAAQALAARFPGLTVLATGGDNPDPDDLLVHDGVEVLLRGERIETSSTHGTGCAFSSALLCRLLHGDSMLAAATTAKRYVEQAMRSATRHGHGRGPMNLLWPVSRRENS